MPDELPDDPFFIQLCKGYTEVETAEIQQYIEEWTAGTYISVAHSILDLTSDLRGYASQMQVRGWIENEPAAIAHLQTLRLFSIPAITQFYFESDQHYPKLKEYVRRLDYLRLLLLEYLQTHTQPESA